MLLARHHEESESNYDEPSSEPSPEPKISSTHSHSNSTLEDPAVFIEKADPAVPETSKPTRNGQEVNYVGEVRTTFGCSVSSLLLFTLLSCCSTLYHVRLYSSVLAWTVLDWLMKALEAPQSFLCNCSTYLLLKLDYKNMHFYKYSSLMAKFYNMEFTWVHLAFLHSLLSPGSSGGDFVHSSSNTATSIYQAAR